MKNIILYFILSFSVFLTASPTWAARERYKSLDERSSSANSSYTRTPQNNDYNNRHDRYQSKPKAERDRFDKNLHRYNNFSPEQKQRAQEKWKSFKQETTPEERKYILEKMRRNRRGR